MTAILPYSRPAALAKMDGRTKEARLIKTTRAELTQHVGGSPSATQRALIDRCAMLTLHMAAIDRKTAEGGAMTEHDSRTYLAWSNSLARTLERLGMEKPQPAKTLHDHIAQRGAGQ